MNDTYQKLCELNQEIAHLQQAAAVLNWDEATYLPPKAAKSRAEQMATLHGVAHEKLVSTEMEKTLVQLDNQKQNWPKDSVQARMIALSLRNFERESCIPKEFLKEYTRQVSQTYNAWIQARPANDFAKVRPYLEKSLEMVLQKTQYYKGFVHPLDSLMDEADEGLTVPVVQKIFSELRSKLVPIVQKIKACPLVDNSPVLKHYDIEQQKKFGAAVAKAIGYDFERGRQDVTHHPFCTTFSVDDVRITTRYNENDFGDGFFSTIHESGHAMYEQGVAVELDSTPLAGGTSMSVHESQSRLWENLVGRSFEFWQYYFPLVQSHFPEALKGVTVENFYRAINRVEPSLIRVDADEVTYNLHVMIRFDLEMQMIEGKLAIKDLPAAWNARYESDLGITPPNDTNGVMQDVHWYGGILGGYFQSYTLGNLMSAQFYEAAQKANPQLAKQIQSGNAKPLQQYLTDNIYQHGKRYPTFDLIKRVTGNTILVDPFIAYLQKKYGAIYKIKL